MPWKNHGANNGLWYAVGNESGDILRIATEPDHAVSILNKQEENNEVVKEALGSVYHQLCTDSDLDDIAGSAKYQALATMVGKALAKVDPRNPQIRFKHELFEE